MSYKEAQGRRIMSSSKESLSPACGELCDKSPIMSRNTSEIAIHQNQESTPSCEAILHNEWLNSRG